METFKEYTFEAAHRLPNLTANHPCGRLHGHSFRLRLTVSGATDPKMGWVLDFAELDKALAPWLRKLDHHYLNDIDGLENPTCENIAKWLWEPLKKSLPGLSAIAVYETPECGSVYRGE